MQAVRCPSRGDCVCDAEDNRLQTYGCIESSDNRERHTDCISHMEAENRKWVWTTDHHHGMSVQYM